MVELGLTVQGDDGEKERIQMQRTPRPSGQRSEVSTLVRRIKPVDWNQ